MKLYSVQVQEVKELIWTLPLNPAGIKIKHGTPDPKIEQNYENEKEYIL